MADADRGRALIDHAATLLRLANCPGDYSHDMRVSILREAAEHIVALRQQLAIADERAANLSAGYARLIEQAAEIVGEAARAVR